MYSLISVIWERVQQEKEHLIYNCNNITAYFLFLVNKQQQQHNQVIKNTNQKLLAMKRGPGIVQKQDIVSQYFLATNSTSQYITHAQLSVM